MKTEEKIKRLERKLKALKEELKKPKFENGWYSSRGSYLLHYNFDTDKAYGFCKGRWFKDKAKYLFSEEHDTPATKEEVKSALIAEAEKRGFKEGVKIKTPNSKFTGTCGEKFSFAFDIRIMYCGGYAIFNNGIWADIISEPKLKINGKDVFITDPDLPFAYIKIGCSDEIDLNDFRKSVNLLSDLECVYIHHHELGKVYLSDLKKLINLK